MNIPAQPEPQRVVHCEDALAWLERSDVLTSCSLVASLPDVSEFPKLSLAQWQQWFLTTATFILSRTPADGVTVFYQSDIKFEGRWIDKGFLCQRAAEECGHALLWHKIVCRTPPGQATFGRTGYSHALCFSREVRVEPAASTPDVLPEIGEKTWVRGMGLKACVMIARFIARHTNSHTVVNPFCGEGSMLAAANAMGLSAIGIERSRKRAVMARTLGINLELGEWERNLGRAVD